MVKYYSFYVGNEFYALFYDIENNKYWIKDSDLFDIIYKDYKFPISMNWINKVRTIYEADSIGVVTIPLGEYTICGIPNVDIKIELNKYNHVHLYVDCPSKSIEFYYEVGYHAQGFFKNPNDVNSSGLVYILGYSDIVQMFLQNTDCCADFISFIIDKVFVSSTLVFDNASIKDCSTIYNLDK